MNFFAKNPDAQGNGLRLLTVTANNEGDTSSFYRQHPPSIRKYIIIGAMMNLI